MASARGAAPTIGGHKVRPTGKSLIVPETPTNDHWLALSNLDRVVNPTFSSVILFYDNTQATHPFTDVVKSLKESLSKTLVEFYPLAGRLELREDGLVDLHCNDRGVVFIEASVDANLKDVGGPQPMPSLSGLEIAGLGKGLQYIPDQLKTMPALVVEVTSFKCGSVAVAANWHHTVADGSSGCHFMKSWSEVATGKQISVHPNHDRSLLKPRVDLDASLVNGYSTRSIAELPPQERACRDATYSRPQIINEKAGQPVLKSFKLDKETVLKLKAEASANDEEHTQFSSAESVSGHLWRQMTKARLENPEGDGDPNDSDTRFFMFVDGRKKLNMPDGYFGNVVCSACAVSTEEKIANNPSSYAASLIRKATKDVSAEYFRSLIDWVELQGSAPAKSEHVNSVGHDVAATFWTFFPLYDMNFGWGNPELAARNSPARDLIDGIAMMPSPDGPGNMVALVNTQTDRMDKLQTQKSLHMKKLQSQKSLQMAMKLQKQNSLGIERLQKQGSFTLIYS